MTFVLTSIRMFVYLSARSLRNARKYTTIGEAKLARPDRRVVFATLSRAQEGDAGRGRMPSKMNNKRELPTA